MLTTAEEVAVALKLPAATSTDPAFVLMHEAAEGYISERCRWDEDNPPASLRQAVVLLVGRYRARRNSPDGLVGMGDLGVMRVPAADRDVAALIAPHRRVVFG